MEAACLGRRHCLIGKQAGVFEGGYGAGGFSPPVSLARGDSPLDSGMRPRHVMKAALLRMKFGEPNQAHTGTMKT